MTSVADPGPGEVPSRPDRLADWPRMVAPYRGADTTRSVFQLVTTWAAFFALWAAAYATLSFSLPLALLLDIVLGLVIVRLFVLQHDCGHGSFLRNDWANFVVGSTIGVLTMTPYEAWRHDHAIHHATTGDLDRRGTGDIITWTVAEYEAASPRARLGYRISRNPLVVVTGGAVATFLLLHRVPGMLFRWGPSRRERLGIHATTILGFGLWAAIVVIFGWRAFVFVHLPAAFVGAAVGIFLFYVQHKFPGVYWRRHEEWDYVDACLLGSSHLEVPRGLRWFAGDIGIHHLHHLAPRIPNYRLRECLRQHPALQCATTLTLPQAWKGSRLILYDEARRQMVRP